jgi:AbrB family looped-hinge helix DNA binding protein
MWYYRASVGNTRLHMSTTVTRKGQVTIPKAIRDRLGLVAGSRLEFQLLQDGRVTLVAEGTPPPKFSFAQFRGYAGPGMTTDEVMALTRGEE